jgi:N-acetylmuramoyl-L-alanine amidase CwlA
MNISLDGLGVGKWRYFSASEIEKMNEIIAGSHNTDQQIPKTRAPKTRKEKPPVVAHDEEPTQPFDEYEVVRPTKKRKTGNQWWSNNINQKQKKEKPELEAFPETTKLPAQIKGPVRNKKAAAGSKPFKRSEKPTGKKANTKGRSANAQPFNRKEQKPSRGRR